MDDGDDGKSHARPHGLPIVGHGLVAVVVLAVFWPCLSAGLVFDDWQNFDRNQPLRDGDWWALVSRPYYGSDTTYWRPLTSLAMGLAYLAGPFGVHLLAMVVHTAAALAVGAIARVLLGDARCALAAALLFALHPLQVESVAWGSALPGPISGMFVLLAVLAVLSWCRRNDSSLPWLAGVWLLGALLAKESGIFAVPLLAAVVVGIRGERSRAAKAAMLGAAALVTMVWLVVHVAVAGWRPVLGEGRDFVVGAAITAARNAALLAWPWPLTPFREHPRASPDPAVDAVFVLAVGCGLAVLALAWRRFAVPWRVAVALLLVPLLLSALTFDAVGPHPVADRYLYVAVAGFALVLVTAARRHVVWLAPLVLGHALVTNTQCHVWRDDRSFASHVLATSPEDPSVHVLAAAHGLGTGDAAGLALARREYHIALGLWPHRTDAFARRQRAAAIAGLAWCDFQDPTCAEGADAGALLARFRAALAQDDGYVPAWVGIGVAYAREQRFEPALAAFAAALAIDPMCPEAWFNQARAQHAIGWRAEARLSFDRALRCDPRLAAAAAHALASR